MTSILQDLACYSSLSRAVLMLINSCVLLRLGEVESACVALAQLMFPASASSAPPTTPSVQICVEVLLELLTHMVCFFFIVAGR